MFELKNVKAALFDFDGVVMDTETQYTTFWDRQGLNHLGRENFGVQIKGMTLGEIFSRVFPNDTELQEKIKRELENFESGMTYDYVPGVCEFVADLRSRGIKTAIVTSSLRRKMDHIFSARPELPRYFDLVLTADDFTRSKPDPECYLSAMDRFGVGPSESLVFEDSFSGLESGRGSGAYVVALSTTNGPDALKGKADCIIPDFTGITLEELRPTTDI